MALESPDLRSARPEKEVAMSDQVESFKSEDSSSGDRPLSIPSELPILPLRDTVLFPNSFMPLAVARESSVRLIDDAIANGKLIAVFTQRDAHPQDVQAARRQPAPHRPGSRPAEAGRDRGGAALSARASRRGRRRYGRRRSP